MGEPEPPRLTLGLEDDDVNLYIPQKTQRFELSQGLADSNQAVL